VEHERAEKVTDNTATMVSFVTPRHLLPTPHPSNNTHASPIRVGGQSGREAVAPAVAAEATASPSRGSQGCQRGSLRWFAPLIVGLHTDKDVNAD
jgi:hypothetical protein